MVLKEPYLPFSNLGFCYSLLTLVFYCYQFQLIKSNQKNRNWYQSLTKPTKYLLAPKITSLVWRILSLGQLLSIFIVANDYPDIRAQYFASFMSVNLHPVIFFQYKKQRLAFFELLIANFLVFNITVKMFWKNKYIFFNSFLYLINVNYLTVITGNIIFLED